MANHAQYSPSKLSNTEKCPCYRTDNTLRKQSGLAAANEGTLIHEAVELKDPSLLDSKDQLYAYTCCDEYEKKLIASCPGRHEIRRECKLTLKGLTYGTADLLIIDPINKIIHIVDWKMGQIAVDHAEHNLQLHAYGAAALERFPSFKGVHLHVVSPRVPDYTDACFNRELLENTRVRIKQIIHDAADPFKKPRGGEHCAFCTNKPRCPVMNEAAIAVTRNAGLLPLPSEFLPEGIVTPEDRAKSLLLARLLPDWCTLVKQINTSAVLEYGEKIPGFSLRRRAGNPSIKNEADVLTFIRETLGVSDADLLEEGIAKLSLSRLAQHLLDNNTLIGMGSKKDVMDALFDQLGDSVGRADEVIYLQKDRKFTDAELLQQLT